MPPTRQPYHIKDGPHRFSPYESPVASKISAKPADELTIQDSMDPQRRTMVPSTETKSVEPRHGHPIYIVFQSAEYTYSEDESKIVGVFKKLDSANACAAVTFETDHGDYLNGDLEVEGIEGFVDDESDGHDEGINQARVTTGRDGAISIEAVDGGDGDISKVYVEKHWLEL